MASWQAHLMNRAVRALVRRRHWGDEPALVRRARRVFGAPAGYRTIVAWDLDVERISNGDVAGEWLRPGRPLTGTVLYIHGGGFVSCSPATHRPITAALARFTQRSVFSLDYRLAPEHRYPAGLQDTIRAYEWLVAGNGASPVAVAGDSAGGNLALNLAVHVRERGLPPPACVVAFSPWTDLAGNGASSRTNDGADPMFHLENIGDFAAAYLDGERPDAPAVSPVYANLAGFPPLLLHVGSTEILLDDARRMHARVGEAGGTSELRIFDNVAHCWQMLVPWVPEATASLREAAAFISRHVTASS